MSSAAAWANTLPLTLWRRGEKDRYGGFTYAEPEIVLCTYRTGGSEEYVDSKGTKYMPSIVYYTEMKTPEGMYLPKPNTSDKLALGEHVGAPPVEAGDIRSVTIYDAKMFGANEAEDYELGV